MDSTDVRVRADARILKVLVVDDHTTFAELLAMALSGLVDVECVGTASTADQSLEMCEREAPDVVVMDVRLGEHDGLEVTRELVARFPQLCVVVLTAHADRALMQRAADSGACSLMPKNGSLPGLLAAIRGARPGGFVVDATLLLSLIAAAPRTPRRAVVMTGRETEVLRLLAEGKDAHAAARELGISVHTCRGYIKNVLAKLGAHSQLEAVTIAMRTGLVRVPEPH